jgi:hypothetical protein
MAGRAFRCAIFDGECMERKRRRRGTHRRLGREEGMPRR